MAAIEKEMKKIAKRGFKIIRKEISKEEALEMMARRSMERRTGARGLRAIMESTLMDLMYQAPSDDTIRKCIITKEVVEGTGKPEIVRGEAPAQPAGRKSPRIKKSGTPETA